MLKLGVAVVATALLLSGPSSAAPPDPVAGAAGIGDPYFPQDGNGGIDVTSYAVHDRYRFSSERLTGWTRVSLRTTEALRSFDLDFLLPVSQVRLSTGRSTFSRPDRHELRITPRHPLAAGTRLRAVIRYAGDPARVSWHRESNWAADAHEVAAINEPHMAAWWFPSDDHPLDKARMDLHLTVPAGYQVIGNGRLAGVRRAARLATYHWTHGGPMATYLAFFVAGHFAIRHGSADGRPYYVAVSRQIDRASRRAFLRVLVQTRRSLRGNSIASVVTRSPRPGEW